MTAQATRPFCTVLQHIMLMKVVQRYCNIKLWTFNYKSVLMRNVMNADSWALYNV